MPQDMGLVVKRLSDDVEVGDECVQLKYARVDRKERHGFLGKGSQYQTLLSHYRIKLKILLLF